MTAMVRSAGIGTSLRCLRIHLISNGARKPSPTSGPKVKMIHFIFPTDFLQPEHVSSNSVTRNALKPDLNQQFPFLDQRLDYGMKTCEIKERWYLTRLNLNLLNLRRDKAGENYAISCSDQFLVLILKSRAQNLRTCVFICSYITNISLHSSSFQ